MIRKTRCVLVVIAVLFTMPDWSRGATPADVAKALDRGKAYHYAQPKDGNWESTFTGDDSALVTYALLAAGESPTDERIAAAVDYLKKTPTTGVYALAMRCQVWLLLPQTAETKQMMRKDANVLLASMHKDPKLKGMYG